MKATVSKIVFLLFVLTMVSTTAIALAPEGVPELEPLQPAPAYIKPNIEQNITREAQNPIKTGEDEAVQPDPKSSDASGDIMPELPQENLEQASDPSGSSILYLVAFGMFVTLALVVLAVKHHAHNQHK